MQQTINEQESSSDDMINIQIEESLVRETLMSIDSANFTEDIFTLLGFGVILLIMISIGIFGPPIYDDNYHEFPITKEMAITTENVLFKNIVPMNRAVSLNLYMKNSTKNLPGSYPISFNYRVTCYKNQSVIQRTQRIVTTVNATMVPKYDNSLPLLLFTDLVLNYDSIEVKIDMDHTAEYFNKGIIVFTKGSQSHSAFQVYFRILLMVLCIVYLLFFLLRLCSMPIKLWHLEQKLTVPLLFLAIFFNNPFYVVHIGNPSHVYVILDRILCAIFQNYFKFFILVLFDSLRYKNRKTDSCFFLPKIVFCVLMFIFTVIHGIYDDIVAFGETPLNGDPLESKLRWTEFGFFLFYLIWASISVIMSAFQVDLTERYKFNVYASAGGVTLLLMAVIQVLFRFFKLFGDSSVNFVMTYAIQNVFAVLMSYFHWPYEVLTDQYYGDSGQPQQDLNQNLNSPEI